MKDPGCRESNGYCGSTNSFELVIVTLPEGGQIAIDLLRECQLQQCILCLGLL